MNTKDRQNNLDGVFWTPCKGSSF